MIPFDPKNPSTWMECRDGPNDFPPLSYIIEVDQGGGRADVFVQNVFKGFDTAASDGMLLGTGPTLAAALSDARGKIKRISDLCDFVEEKYCPAAVEPGDHHSAATADWQTVPMEPTEQMLKAGFEAAQYEFLCRPTELLRSAYKAMLAAAEPG